jgi:hypothetical protein
MVVAPSLKSTVPAPLGLGEIVAVNVTVSPYVLVLPGDELATDVVVVCVTITATSNVPLLGAKSFVGTYVAVIVCVPLPTAEGVYVTVGHEAFAPEPEREHVVAENVPDPLLLRLTVPVGVCFAPCEMS